ncbi:PREDICTED: fibroblast growth factor receptor homolog 1-like [Acropora digitifera]|uniref:fibroblast growth factor receptor homolog 1-like n=1 Tax=Acropora digitifera TaxID=70779 RepID=UPI00077AC157|nr:PREDICTED: fibroblast growth factor receptor homolog 1-like [Acropora digitifera]
MMPTGNDKGMLLTIFSVIYGVVFVVDGGSITWYEPPPFETVTDTLIIPKSNKSLIKGSVDKELSCNFSLTMDLRIFAVSMKSGVSTIATYLQSRQALSVTTSFKSRFNASWVPNKLTLILLNLTSADEGEYRCEVITFGRGAQTWIRKIQVSLVVPPSISQIGGKTAIEGDDVTLKCIAQGTPTPSITWKRLSDNSVVTMPLINISRHDAKDYRCTADNGVETPAIRDVTIDVQYLVEATGRGKNAFVAKGIVKTFTCPVNGNPEPNIEWYSEKTGRKISSGKQYNAAESGCYSCVASNSLGTAVNITQCLIVEYESSPTVPSTTVSGGQEIRAILTIITNFRQAFKDLYSASSKQFVATFEKEMDKVYMNMPEYIRTEVTQLRPGSVIVYFILYFEAAVTPDKGIENLRVAISSNGTFGDFQAKDLVLHSEERTKSTTTTEVKCTCSDNNTTLLVIIGVLGTVVFVLFAVIIWQQRKLRVIRNKRPYEVPQERDAGFYDSEIAMKDPTHLQPKKSTQHQIADELGCMPLQRISSTGEGSNSPVSPAPNVEYAPLDMRTCSWEVERNEVKVEKIIGKGAFGQVAKGTAKNLPLRSEATIVAIKMVKANALESDKRDLKSELELMKTLKPHPHVIKLLGCVTESEPLLVLIEYVPYGDLLGYLRKSRGLNDTYYKDPDIKPQTSLTSQQLMRFAWQIADGMSYLSLRKVVHRDLAARNVLVGERETCKITDFGMARDVQQENIYERKTKGRLPVKWTAYESLLYGQYTTKSTKIQGVKVRPQIAA